MPLDDPSTHMGVQIIWLLIQRGVSAWQAQYYADALSCRDKDVDKPQAYAISRPEFALFEEFCRESQTLADIVAKHYEIDAGIADKEWTIVDGFVMHQGRMFGPECSQLWS